MVEYVCFTLHKYDLNFKNVFFLHQASSKLLEVMEPSDHGSQKVTSNQLDFNDSYNLKCISSFGHTPFHKNQIKTEWKEGLD